MSLTKTVCRSRPNVLFQKMVLKLESTTAESNEKVPVQIKFDNLGENSPFLKTIHPDGTKQKKKYRFCNFCIILKVILR